MVTSHYQPSLETFLTVVVAIETRGSHGLPSVPYLRPRQLGKRSRKRFQLFTEQIGYRPMAAPREQSQIYDEGCGLYAER